MKGRKSMRLSQLDMRIRLDMGIIDGLVKEYEAVAVPFFWWKFWRPIELAFEKQLKFGRYWVVSWYEEGK